MWHRISQYAKMVCQSLGEVTLNYVEQEIVLETETAYGSDIPLPISASLLRRLEETARPCVRMVLEGTSASVGAPPAWLERASDVRTLGFSERNGKSVFHVKAPKLGDAVPEISLRYLIRGRYGPV